MFLRWPAALGLLVVSAASCSGRPEETEGSAPGEAAEALAGAYCITDVQTDPRTYHFDSPRWVLQAAEGIGPRVLTVTVAGYAAPLLTTTLSRHPKASDLSTAVGYSLGEFYYLQASGAYTVAKGSDKRLEAYVNYARSVWVVREAGCGAVLGTGTSFKPIGIYFAARDTASVAIPGSSVISFVPGCTGGACGVALEPDPTSPPTSDAVAGDKGGP